MNARQVHRWMAAALTDPGLLARWRRDPGLAPGELDLDAMWKFAGLSEKVKHNGCRSHLQLTFRLLNKLGLEIDAFAGYAAAAAEHRRQGRRSVDDRTAALAEFLEGWLDPHRDDHALVLDLMRHELAIARLRQLAAGGAMTRCERAPARAPTAASVPRIRGELLLHAMEFDARIVAERVRHGPTFDNLPRGTLHLGYWWDGASPELRLLELDEPSACLLALVDGATSIEALAARLGCAAPLLLEPFTALGELGLVQLVEARPCA